MTTSIIITVIICVTVLIMFISTLTYKHCDNFKVRDLIIKNQILENINEVAIDRFNKLHKDYKTLCEKYSAESVAKEVDDVKGDND